ncbi:helix-turn-helix domain-containing protein [Mesorhizobium huakuii]|uniref:helix-turn-helix domain-containing protein n=1 Tax=Mesorhizobium huakuii TaxID=28104 RepID=UPI003D78F24F
MPQTTLRRHLAVLVECGLIIRQDTPQRQKTCEVASGRRDRAGFRLRWGSCWPPARACGNSPGATKFATGGIFWRAPSLSGPCWDHPERVAGGLRGAGRATGRDHVDRDLSTR